MAAKLLIRKPNKEVKEYKFYKQLLLSGTVSILAHT
jgi:hypothetical protein